MNAIPPIGPAAVFSAPFAVGGCLIPNRVVLAPMAGITNRPFRLHMKSHGAGLVYSEMASSYGLLHANSRTSHYIEVAEEERPVGVQLFGDDPATLATAVRLVLDRAQRPDIIDINLGCPVKKVVKTGAGAALLSDPARAVAAAAAVVAAAAEFGVPVTAKIRSGPDPEHVIAPQLARQLEQAGVAALGLHPRAATQFYRGRADHDVTARVVEQVGIPVMASGDIDSFAGASDVLTRTGAAAVMVGRGVLGDPWLVGRILAGTDDPTPRLTELIEDLRTLYRATLHSMGEKRAVPWMRKHVAWYLRRGGVRGTAIEDFVRLRSFAEVDEALSLLVEGVAPEDVR